MATPAAGLGRRNRAGIAGQYFVKAPPALGPSLVLNEAAALQHLWGADPAGAARWAPKLLLHDAAADTLVTELVRDAVDLASHHGRVGRSPSWCAGALGAALAWVHGLPGAERVADTLRAEWPFGIRVHRPVLDDIAEMSPANARLVRIVQRSAPLREGLERLREGWRPTALIHGDVRFENVLVHREGRSGRRLRLVDWEMATVGDPAWDVGSAFASYLEPWVISHAEPIGAPRGARRRSIRPVQHALRHLWTAYVGRSGLASEGVEAMLRRGVAYCAARLVQLAYERSMRRWELADRHVLLLQVAENVAARPQDALSGLLGLDPPSALAP